MKFIEILVLFGGGYVCGISCGSGFVFQAIRKLFADSWSPKKRAAWLVLAVANILICSQIAVVLIAFLVIGDQPDRPDFWPRFGWYAGGLLVGISLVFVAVHLVNVGLRSRSQAREA